MSFNSISTISISNLTFAFDGASDLFTNLSLNLSTDWCLGLIGRNGRGKTTFLRLLAGQLKYQGTIQAKVERLYFPFELNGPTLSPPDQSPFEYKGTPPDGFSLITRKFPTLLPWRLSKEADLIALKPDCLSRPVSTLSPGETTKLKLAALFALDNVFPLIDEPTSGLDETGRRAVAGFLSQKRGFIVASHDRFLLESVVDHIIALGRQGPELYKGTFNTYWSEYKKRVKSEENLAKKLSEEIDRLAQAAKRTSAWSSKAESTKFGHGPVDRGFIGHKAAKMNKRSKSVAQRHQKAFEDKKNIGWIAERSPAMSLSPVHFQASRLIEGRGLCLGYDQKAVLVDLDLNLQRGERLAVKGPNGCGKSLLLSILAGSGGTILGGSLRLPKGLILSYVPQRLQTLALTISELCQEKGVEETKVKSLLHYLGFDRAALSAKIHELSQGQLRKLILASSLASQAHLYLWDEPLDFLDLFSRDQIEDLILESQPSLIIIEHDLTFIDRVASGILDLTPYSRAVNENKINNCLTNIEY
ncbi:MAG: ATP-binding cassette domain-containing protein [Deltaproteobacteria bacterium]|jgi:lincosamide and streptogramin A transport system ATP-binding/permease protein|nr:ATP-binding cassette domain-containing protein [Deltaproteobacteria bacterium]